MPHQWVACHQPDPPMALRL